MKGPHAPALRSPESQVTLVGVLFLVWGGITILIGVSTLALGVAAASLITAAADAGRGQVAAGLTAATFTLFAIIAIVWGAGHLVVGAHVRRRRHWSRLVALLLASIDLLLVPYGTALGVYTLWVLLHEEAKRQFEVAVVATP
ncbi:MAG: hypothetical protein QM736_11070 [Vicinamibacterales bacterium]